MALGEESLHKRQQACKPAHQRIAFVFFRRFLLVPPVVQAALSPKAAAHGRLDAATLVTMGRYCFLLLLIACAEGSPIGVRGASAGGTSQAGADADTGGGGRGGQGGLGGMGGAVQSTGGTGAGGSAAVASTCDAGSWATGVDDTGQLLCANADGVNLAAVNDGCSVYLGVRDGCTTCSDPPSKWGRVDGSSCELGAGLDNTCTNPLLGGSMVQLFGLNPDGDVDENDKFHLGFRCNVQEPVAGACAPGSWLIGFTGQDPVCAPASTFALQAVRDRCSLYWGWRDGCDACSSPPTHWGRVATNDCSAIVAAGDTCVPTTLAAEQVYLFGLSTGGDVDGNDKFYVGMHCAAAALEAAPAAQMCPVGQAVTAILASGELMCESPAEALLEQVRPRCRVTFGWIDGCNGCTSPPTKWGRAGDGFCNNESGLDNTCAATQLGSDSVQLFGLSTDGNVNDDDKFFVGFQCQ